MITRQKIAGSCNVNAISEGIPVSAIAAKAFVAAQVHLRECNKQMHLLNDADKLVEDEGRDEYVGELRIAFRATIRRLYATMLIMFEDLGLAHSLAAFQEGYSALADQLTKLAHFEGEREFVSNPAIDYLREQLDLFAPLIDVPSDMSAKRSVLSTMLKQTPSLMQRLAKAPVREKDVQDELEAVLALAFPDTIREPSIAKQTKVYKPDFGIDSVETAIEVKFIGNASEVGTVLGQLYEDMRGYNDASSYTLFLGLIYMTGHFVSQERVDAEAAKTDVPKNWSILVVTGPGFVAPPAAGSGRKRSRRPAS